MYLLYILSCLRPMMVCIFHSTEYENWESSPIATLFPCQRFVLNNWFRPFKHLNLMFSCNLIRSGNSSAWNICFTYTIHQCTTSLSVLLLSCQTGFCSKGIYLIDQVWNRVNVCELMEKMEDALSVPHVGHKCFATLFLCVEVDVQFIKMTIMTYWHPFFFCGSQRKIYQTDSNSTTPLLARVNAVFVADSQIVVCSM